ncbi:MAG: response regulator [Lachnospiraceae bacterium]|nr:response regulator [Lachnospiraceae bacterium]
MKILLAEDDFASRKFMGKILDKYGETDITVNGLEAVDAYLMAQDDDEPYDMVVLDVMMPMLDGYQVLSTIRKLEAEKNIPMEKRAKVIMTTALNEELNVKKAMEIGCDAYVGKPVNVDRFEVLMSKLGFEQKA